MTYFYKTLIYNIMKIVEYYNINSDGINSTVNSLGNRMTVINQNSFGLDSTMIKGPVTLKVTGATIWWTMINIGVSQGNNVLTYTLAAGADKTITIDDGLYDIDALNDAIQRGLVNNGDTAGIITFAGEYASQKTVMTLNGTAAAIVVKFTETNSFKDLIGFTTSADYASPTTTLNFTSPAVAQMSSINYFLIQSDLVNSGIPTNGITTGTIAKVNIDVLPGSQINYKPFIPYAVDASKLLNNGNLIWTYTLTSDNGADVDTNSNSWSVDFSLEYDLKD